MNQADSNATQKGGGFSFGTRPSGDFRGASFGFYKNNQSIISYSVTIHSNDPNLETNYTRYPAEQLVRFNKYVIAAFYVVARDLAQQIKALP